MKQNTVLSVGILILTVLLPGCSRLEKHRGFPYILPKEKPNRKMSAALLDWRPRGGLAGFRDQCFDFIFSSHCLEDFADIPAVLTEWWRKIKLGGYLVLLLPDMEGGRYPKVGESGGNPSHVTNVGVEYMRKLTQKLFGDGCEIVQCDTIREGCTFDFVARRKR